MSGISITDWLPQPTSVIKPRAILKDWISIHSLTSTSTSRNVTPLLNPYNSIFVPLLYRTSNLLQTHCKSLVKPYSVRVIKCVSGMPPFSVNKCFQNSFSEFFCYKNETTEKHGNPTPECLRGRQSRREPNKHTVDYVLEVNKRQIQHI